MEKEMKFQGIIPPIPTTLYADEKLDVQGQKNLIDFLIDSGVHGLFFLGSGGEFSQMPIKLRKKVAELGVKYTDGRVPVLIGTGASNTLETIELSLHAKNIGADGVVIINPYYWKLNESTLFNYYSEIAQNVDLPIILYNFPSLTGQVLDSELVLKLVKEHKNIVGIKQSVEDVAQIRDMIFKVKKINKNFSVFSGFDDHLLHNLSTGGDGAIPLTSSFFPEASIGLYNAFHHKDIDNILKWHYKLSKAVQLYQIDTPFINVAKEAIKNRGINISTEMLPPLSPLSSHNFEVLNKMLEDLYSDTTSH